MKKKTILFILLPLLLIFLLLVIYIYFNDNYKFKFEYEIYNYFKFSNGKKLIVEIPSDNNIKYLNGKDILDKLKNKDATIIYFGYSYCPWCRSIINPLVEIVNENKIDNFYYVNVKKMDSSVINELKNTLDNYLKYDEEGIKKLYLPDVYFVKDGDIKYHYISNIESYLDPFVKMSDEEKKELKEIYQKGINLIK